MQKKNAPRACETRCSEHTALVAVASPFVRRSNPQLRRQSTVWLVAVAPTGSKTSASLEYLSFLCTDWNCVSHRPLPLCDSSELLFLLAPLNCRGSQGFSEGFGSRCSVYVLWGRYKNSMHFDGKIKSSRTKGKLKLLPNLNKTQ